MAGEIELIISQVSAGAAWQDLDPGIQQALQMRANELLSYDRIAWGPSGLAEKEKLLVESPTPAMLENIDRILSNKFATELPDGFQLTRDVSNIELKRMLLRVYLSETSTRGYMLLDHSDFQGWDGLPIQGVELLDHQHVQTIALYLAETEDRLRKLSDQELTPTERLFRDKLYFTTRSKTHFGKPHVGRHGSFGFANIFGIDFGAGTPPFATSSELLDAYNASMFSEFRDVNIGTLQAFVWDHELEFDEPTLSGLGIEPALVKKIMTLGYLYRTRVLAHPDREKPYTVYTAMERAAIWDTFTAEMVSNEDGKETLEDYAAGYAQTSRLRAREMQILARATVDELFPADSLELSAEQRMHVYERIDGENRPAAMIEAICAALNEATGAATASGKVNAAIEQQTAIGGYEDAEGLRPADEDIVIEMWDKIRDFIDKNYRGFKIDIAALIPDRPIISPSGVSCTAGGGNVSIGLKIRLVQADLYSTMMHEIKHVIDQKSGSAVEGASWEGAAFSIERQVAPLFLAEAMAGSGAEQLVSQLLAAVENVRVTSTTDAALKILLRQSDGGSDSFEFAKEIVAGYGYSDPGVLARRAQRANASTQYLEYDYGLVKYTDLLSYLQAGVGTGTRVDAFLLQACGMPSPKKNQTFIDRLKGAIESRILPA